MANFIIFHMVRFPSYEYIEDCNRDYVVFCNEGKEMRGEGRRGEERGERREGKDGYSKDG